MSLVWVVWLHSGCHCCLLRVLPVSRVAISWSGAFNPARRCPVSSPARQTRAGLLASHVGHRIKIPRSHGFCTRICPENPRQFPGGTPMLRVRPILHTPHAAEWAALFTALGLGEIRVAGTRSCHRPLELPGAGVLPRMPDASCCPSRTRSEPGWGSRCAMSRNLRNGPSATEHRCSWKRKEPQAARWKLRKSLHPTGCPSVPAPSIP